MPEWHNERTEMMRSILFMTTALSFTFFTLASAHASEGMVKYLPETTKFVVGFNMDALKPAPIYKQMMGVLKQQPNIANALDFLESAGGFDVEKDIEAVVVGFPEPVTTQSKSQTLSVVIRGNFDQEKLLAASTKRFENLQTLSPKKGTKHFVQGDFSFGFVDDDELVMTLGQADYREATWKAVDNSKKAISTNSDVKRVLAQINTKRGIWIVGLTRTLPQKGPKMNSAGITLDVVKGLKLDMVSNMASKEAAKQAATEMEGLKNQKSSPMVTMLGAAPLLENLKVNPSKDRVNVSTSMTQAQFDAFIKQMAATMAQGMQQTQPTPGATQPAQPTDKKKGVEADFN